MSDTHRIVVCMDHKVVLWDESRTDNDDSFLEHMQCNDMHALEVNDLF